MFKTAKSNHMIILFVLVAFGLQNGLFAQDPKFQQTNDEEGLVSMEVENISQARESTDGDTYWEAVTAPVFYSGDSAMQAMPAGEERHKVLADAQDNAPTLEYLINFVSTDPVYVWVRASHLDGYDDSVWFGLDDAIEGTVPVQFMVEEQEFADVWYWICHLMNDTNDRAILQVPSTGVHIFKLYMREPSFKADKVVLTTLEAYRPDDEVDEGPDETLYVPNAVPSEVAAPGGFELGQNYPNPFNPVTTIDYTLPNAEFVTLTMYNHLGQEVETLVNEIQSTGNHQVTWTANDYPSGLYFYTLQAGEFSETKKLILQK